jgi:hypothetical protein
MSTTSTIILLFLIVLIGFNIWNTVTLKRLLSRPLKNDQLNDKSYWELKYKMQYMVTVFSVLIAIAAYLGYNTIDDVKESVRKEFQGKLDSTKANMILIDSQIRNSKIEFDTKVANTDSVLNSYQNMLLGLSNRTESVKKSISLSDKDLNTFKNRIAEINSKNIIQQNIYIIDNLEYTFGTEWEYKKYYFKDFITNTGQKLPNFKKNPFILPVSNQGYTFSINKVTTESFELVISNASPTEKNDNNFRVTLFITENP